MTRRTRGLLLAGLTVALGMPAAAQEPGAATLALDSLLATPISASAKYAQTARDAASSVTVLTHEQIERFGYRTLPDLLSGVSGFYLSDDRNYVYLGARGFSRPADYNNRILLLIDGHQMNEGIWGAAALELPIILEDIERVEIVRGPGSALYGTGAVFGVINIVTRSGSSIDGAQGELRSGSHGRRGGALMLGRRTAGGVDLSFSGMWDGNDGQDMFYPEFDTPGTNGGVAHNLDWEQRWQMRGRAASGGWTVQGWLSARTKAIPTASYEMEFGRPAKTMDSFGYLEVRHERNLDASKHLRVRGYYDRYRYEGLYAYEEADLDEWGRGDVVGAEISHRWDVASSHRLTAGAEYRRHLRAEYDFEPALPGENGFDAPWSSASVFAEHEFHAARGVTLLAGGRVEDYATAPTVLVPRAAILLDPSRGTTIKLLYGRSFRAPNVYEARNETETWRRNPDLREERGSTLEAVLQQRLGTGLLGSVSVFRYHMNRLIDLTVDPDGLYVYRNAGRAEADGAELGFEARFPGVSGYANYTYQRARDELNGALTNSPGHLAKAGLSLDVARGVGSAVEGRYESSRQTVYGTSTSAYAVTNLHLWWSPEPAPRGEDERLLLSVRVSNLFDASYATPGGVEHVQDGIRQEGRRLSADLRYRF